MIVPKNEKIPFMFNPSPFYQAGYGFYQGGWIVIRDSGVYQNWKKYQRSPMLRNVLEVNAAVLVGQIRFAYGFSKEESVEVKQKLSNILNKHYRRFLQSVIIQRAILGLALYRKKWINKNGYKLFVPEAVNFQNKIILYRQNDTKNKMEYVVITRDFIKREAVISPQIHVLQYEEPSMLEFGALSSIVECLADTLDSQWDLMKSTIDAEHLKQKPRHIVNKTPEDPEKLKKIIELEKGVIQQETIIHGADWGIMDYQPKQSKDYVKETKSIDRRYEDGIMTVVEGNWGRKISESKLYNGYDKLDLYIRLCSEIVMTLVGNTPNQTKYQNNSNIQFTAKTFTAKMILNKERYEDDIKEIFVKFGGEDLRKNLQSLGELVESTNDPEAMDERDEFDVFITLNIHPLASMDELIKMLQILKNTEYDILALVLSSAGVDPSYLEKFRTEKTKVVSENEKSEVDEQPKKKKKEDEDEEEEEDVDKSETEQQ